MLTSVSMTGVRSQHRAKTGFSLVEMLVSLAVMGLAAWLLTAGIQRMALGMQIAGREDTRLGGIAGAQFLLRQRLAAIEPVADPQAAGRALAFTGQAQSVDFIGRTADRDAPGALQHYRLQRNDDGDLVLLSLSTLDARTDPHAGTNGQPPPGWTALTVVPGTAQIAIRYLGQNPLVAGEHGVWQTNWSHRASLPLLVRIAIAFADGDRRRWPELVVHPRAAIPDPCLRDAVTGGCAAPSDGAT